jgi:hypothetical protein
LISYIQKHSDAAIDEDKREEGKAHSKDRSCEIEAHAIDDFRGRIEYDDV